MEFPHELLGGLPVVSANCLKGVVLVGGGLYVLLDVLLGGVIWFLFDLVYGLLV